MKYIRSGLQLFALGGEGCAAEQSSQSEAADKAASKAAAAYEPQRESTAMAVGKNGDTDENSTIRADNEGVSISRNDPAAELKSLRQRAALLEKLRERQAKKNYLSLVSEAERLSSKVKDFDLRRELSDRRFGAMIRSGLSLEDAWQAIHAGELIKKAREEADLSAYTRAREALMRTAARPEENGSDGRAPAKSHTSVESLSGKGIRDILRRVENGAKIKF